jgi:hypothetical protein
VRQRILTAIEGSIVSKGVSRGELGQRYVWRGLMKVVEEDKDEDEKAKETKRTEGTRRMRIPQKVGRSQFPVQNPANSVDPKKPRYPLRKD